ncbi:MAG: hypothetical protein WB607_16535 [Candidatus Acidiferrum sp.]
MQILRTMKGCFLAALLFVAITGASVPTAGQTSQGSEPLALSAPVVPLQPSASGDRIFADLVKHNELRSARLREYSAVRTYAVTDLNGKVHAKEIVQMEYIAPDKKTFVTVAEEGSGVIRNLVLKRLMESEISAAAGKERHDSSITPANYTFRLLNEDDLDNHHCFVVEAIPKRNDKYLFEGKIWIDSSEFAIVKIAGHPAKNLSFWITRADFVRRYEKIRDFWLPASDETFVEVRLYGKKILGIEHHIKSVNGVTSTPLVRQNPREAESTTHGS